jgi:hypothetical protein
MKENKRQKKYSENNLIPMFIKAAEFRNEMIAAGFTDNGGSIHSAERIINLLGQRLKYPTLGHGNNYKDLPDAEFSEEALKKFNNGEKVYVEHVAPIRDFTKLAIKVIDEAKESDGNVEEELKNFILDNYRLVMLTAEETTKLNRNNRIKVDKNRLDGLTIIKKNH